MYIPTSIFSPLSLLNRISGAGFISEAAGRFGDNSRAEGSKAGFGAKHMLNNNGSAVLC